MVAQVVGSHYLLTMMQSAEEGLYAFKVFLSVFREGRNSAWTGPN